MSKPCAFINQSLIDHSYGSYKILYDKGFLDESYYKTVNKRLGAKGIKINENDIKRLIEITVKLHDIGKVAEFYQNQFDDNCNSIYKNKSPTFKYHEIGSALFFYYSDYIETMEIKKLIALAALNHLNAIRGIKNLSPNRLPKDANLNMLKMEKYGEPYLKIMGYSFEVKDYTINDYINMMNDFLTNNGHYLKLYNLFLAPIIVGDNLDSHYARSINEKRGFISLLERELS